MLIVSKFHDYYDTASIYGVDKTCVYLRNEEKVEVQGKTWNSEPYLLLKDDKRFPLGKLPRSDSKAYIGFRYDFYKCILGFCGELYPVIKVVKTYDDKSEEVRCFYDHSSFKNFVAEYGLEDQRRYRYGRWYMDDFNVDSEQGLFNFFEQHRWNKLEGLFAAYHVPCFVLGDKYLKLNPNLKTLQFMGVKDPQTAFQDVYMYLSGVLGAPIPPKEKMSDKVLAAAKGHDGEYSFKKPPGKRGKKKWR